jgi:sterol desaturase/sphingolipid hydroxylase (fatty acid hydroxylase superfamily)
MFLLLFFSFLPCFAFWASICVAFHLQIAESAHESVARRKTLAREAIVTTLAQSAAMLVTSVFFVSKWHFRWWTVPLGMVVTDTFQYTTHYMYHKQERLFRMHATHHQLRPMSALGALHNSHLSKFVGGLGLVFVFCNVLRYSFLEFSLLTSLAMIAVVREHCPGLGDTPHSRHHEGLHGNWQEPFGSYLDHLFGTIV